MARPLLSAENAATIVAALETRHARKLRDERFTVSARMEGQTVVVDLSLARLDGTFLYEMQAAKSVPDDGSLSVADTLDLCMDFLDWYLGRYFEEDRELLLPLDHQPHRFGEHEVLARGDVRNPTLDDAADAWLRGERPEVPDPRRRLH
ncbi:MAG: hypothetical protein H6744_07480 [Deltaproteobacteria bacterium]|nr:hypothetical protein [Deltaproteobacteria bacterium]MCB9786521.1 hypothetical protein [Deltaproteobacteria bacterium]